MILVNEKLPNMKFALGKDVVSTDEKGQIEVKDAETIEALKASGFSEVGGKSRFKTSEVKTGASSFTSTLALEELAEAAPESVEEEVKAEDAEVPFYKKNKKR
jgi:hypothetical protein